MITATTRRCSACRDLVDAEAKACPSCGRAMAPRVEEWPDGAKRLLYLFILVDAIGIKMSATEQQQAEWLLENAMRGRHYEGRLVSYSATAAQCYEEFLRLFQRWTEAGSPTDFAAVAQLRGVR